MPTRRTLVIRPSSGTESRRSYGALIAIMPFLFLGFRRTSLRNICFGFEHIYGIILYTLKSLSVSVWCLIGGGPTSDGRPGHSKTDVPEIAPTTCRPQRGKLMGSLTSGGPPVQLAAVLESNPTHVTTRFPKKSNRPIRISL